MYKLALILLGCITSHVAYAQVDLLKLAQQRAALQRQEVAGCFIPTPKGVIVGIDHHYNTIQLPMGKIDRGESPRDAAKRKANEETGVAVNVGRMIRTWIQDKRIHLFLCTPKFGTFASFDSLRSTAMIDVIVLDPVKMVDHNNKPVNTQWRYQEDRKLLTELWTKWLNN